MIELHLRSGKIQPQKIKAGNTISSELVIFLILGPYYLVNLPLMAMILNRRHGSRGR